MGQNQMNTSYDFSGKLETIFPDGNISYDGEVGKPEDFPLTPPEIKEVKQVLGE